MKRWLEPAKSVILSLLVVVSFCLTGLIWSNQPNFQFIEPVQYTESAPVQERTLDKLVAPQEVVFHYGTDRHTKAVSTDAQYSVIVREMAKWIFLDFSSYTLTDEKWEEIAREKFGVEVRFRGSIPWEVVGQLVTFRDEYSGQLNAVDRIWLYYEQEEDQVYALFLSENEAKVVRSRTSISLKDLRESYLATGDLMPEQIMKIVKLEKSGSSFAETSPSTYWEMYYLPKNQLTMLRFRYSYSTVTNDRLMEAFFLDQSLVRRILERDKTVILTDGSRSIQIRSEQQAITFTDPVYQQRSEEQSDEEKLQGATTFINKHLGWMDEYSFERIQKSYNDKDVITFRQYLGAYPLVSRGTKRIDKVEIISEAGQVVTMNRSLLDLEKYINDDEWKVMSGPELYQMIREKNLADTEAITNAYLAYQTEVTEEYVELVPTWVIEVANQPTLYIPANSGQGGGGSSGLE